MNIFKPFEINFRNWRQLLNCPEDEIIYKKFWFFTLLNILNPKIYSKTSNKVINTH